MLGIGIAQILFLPSGWHHLLCLSELLVDVRTHVLVGTDDPVFQGEPVGVVLLGGPKVDEGHVADMNGQEHSVDEDADQQHLDPPLDLLRPPVWRGPRK